MKNNSDKKRGLIAITVYHLIAAVLFLVLNSVDLNNLKLPDATKGLMSGVIFFVVAGISFFVTLALKKKNNLKPIWVLLNFAITFIRIFGISLMTVLAPEFVEQNIEIVKVIYYNAISTVMYFILLYMTCFASLNGYMKKKPVNPYRNLSVKVDKPIHTQIYEVYGNFGD